MRLKLTALLLTLAAGVALCQPVQNVAVQPECQIFLSATAIANSVSYDNRSKACDRWIVTYSTYTFTAPSLLVQSSADNAGAPAAWVAFAGTLVSGVNPNVNVAQNLTSLSGYYPWMRLSLTAVGVGAGRLTATLYGYKDRPASIAVAGLVSTNLSQYGGTAVGSSNPIYTVGPCTSSAAVTVTAAGSTQIVALTAAQSIRVCHLSLSMQAPVDIKLVQGTGANCAAGPADITGVYSTVLALALDFTTPLVGTAANALCLNLGSAVTGGGVVTYSKY